MSDSKSPSRLRTPLVTAGLLIAALGLIGGVAVYYLVEELGSIKSELEALKSEQVALRKEFAGLDSPQPPQPHRPAQAAFQPVEFGTEGAPSLGDVDAPVTLIEFTDYQCPYCRRHTVNTLPRLIEDYVDTGRLRYLIREMPVEANHPLAGKAAEAALCAGDQGGYWAMHGRLFANQDRLRPGELKQHAQALGLDTARFDRCLDNGEKRKQILKDRRTGRQAGMRGTPAFFLGLTRSEKDGIFRATEVIHGAKSYPDFAILIDDLLVQAGEETAPETTAGVGE
ncbi:MAG: thioredoxin domain-containing protein [Gammaproteobacteria bacterium]